MYPTEISFLKIILSILINIDFKSRKDKQQVKKVIQKIEDRLKEKTEK